MAEMVGITSKAMQYHSSFSLRGRSTYFAFLLMMNPSPHQVPYESLMVQPYPGPVIAPNWKATIDQQVSIFSRSNLIFLPSSGSKRYQPSGIGTWKPSTTTTPNLVLDLLHCLSSWGNSLISCISVYKLTRLIYPPECPRPPLRARQPALLLNIIVTQMNRQQQVEAYEEIQEYLQRNDVYALLGQLVQQVVLEKPKNLLDFLIQKLEAPERFTLFVVGPPGLSINAIIKKALTNVDKQFELFNCGDEITKIHESFREEDKTRFNSCLLVEEASIAGIISKIEALSKTDQNYIIQGFPKNIKQAHLLQKNGIYAKNLLIINIDDAGLREIIGNKIQLLHPDAKTEERNRLVALATMEHKINMEQIKQFYTKYLEIDLSANRQEAFIIRQLNKAFSIKTISSVPRVSSQIIIMGAPFSGRTALGKKIAEHYNFVYISTRFLLAEEIRRDTIHGRKIKSQFINNQLIDNFLIEKLIQERTAKKDCKMQGFVLEGYPKNREQFENIKNMKLSPTLIVAIDAPLELVKPRGPSDPAKLQSRMQKWQSFAAYLRESKEKIFWVNPQLNIGNLYEEVVHEFEKLFT